MMLNAFIPVGLGICFVGVIVGNVLTEKAILKLPDEARVTAKAIRSKYQGRIVGMAMLVLVLGFLLSFGFSNHLGYIVGLITLLWVVLAWTNQFMISSFFSKMPAEFIFKCRKASAIRAICLTVGFVPLIIRAFC